MCFCGTCSAACWHVGCCVTGQALLARLQFVPASHAPKSQNKVPWSVGASQTRRCSALLRPHPCHRGCATHRSLNKSTLVSSLVWPTDSRADSLACLAVYSNRMMLPKRLPWLPERAHSMHDMIMNTGGHIYNSYARQQQLPADLAAPRLSNCSVVMCTPACLDLTRAISPAAAHGNAP